MFVFEFHQCVTLLLVHQARTNKTSWWASENALLLTPRLVSLMKKILQLYNSEVFCKTIYQNLVSNSLSNQRTFSRIHVKHVLYHLFAKQMLSWNLGKGLRCLLSFHYSLFKCNWRNKSILLGRTPEGEQLLIPQPFVGVFLDQWSFLKNCPPTPTRT